MADFIAPRAGRYSFGPPLPDLPEGSTTTVEFDTIPTADMPHAIAGQPVSDEHLRVYEAYLREHNMPVAGASKIPTAALLNQAIDWWNQLRPEGKQHG